MSPAFVRYPPMKTHHHAAITVFAISYAAHWWPQISGRLQRAMRGLIEGCENEDGFELQRGMNWHFYGAEGVEHRSWFGARKTSLHRVKSLCASLNQIDQTDLQSLIAEQRDAKEATRAELIGRLLHHIQDMSCPPHVVPVYHVGADRYEEQMPPLEDFSLVAPEAPMVDPVELYHLSATNTKRLVRDTLLETMETTPEIPPEYTLSAFWIEPPSAEVFSGTYGGPDSKDQFGLSEIVARGEHLTVREGFYQKVYGIFGRKAVTESAQLLFSCFQEEPHGSR